jgi:hypothetical protein
MTGWPAAAGHASHQRNGCRPADGNKALLKGEAPAGRTSARSAIDGAWRREGGSRHGKWQVKWFDPTGATASSDPRCRPFRRGRRGAASALRSWGTALTCAVSLSRAVFPGQRVDSGVRTGQLEWLFRRVSEGSNPSASAQFPGVRLSGTPGSPRTSGRWPRPRTGSSGRRARRAGRRPSLPAWRSPAGSRRRAAGRRPP